MVTENKQEARSAAGATGTEQQPTRATRRDKENSRAAPSTEAPPWEGGDDGATMSPAALAAHQREQAEIRRGLMRKMIDFYGVYRACPRKACRRAGACTVAEVPCFREFLPELRQTVFPGLRKAIRERFG